MARLNAGGAVDESFFTGSGPTGPGASVEAMALQPDGSVLGGSRIFRRPGSCGARDEAFALDLDSVTALALQPDGKFLVSDKKGGATLLVGGG